MGHYTKEQAIGYLTSKIDDQNKFISEVDGEVVRIRLRGGPIVGSVTLLPSWLGETESGFIASLDSALREAFSGAMSQSVMKGQKR